MVKGKKSKAPKSVKVVLVLGLLAALGGAILGFMSLVTQPVTELRSAPEELDPASVYYIKGPNSNSSRWRTVRAEIFKGSAGKLEVSDGDLNSWASAMFTPSQLKPVAAVDGESTPSAPSLFGLKMSVSGVNFRIVDDELQMAAYLEFPSLAPGKRIAYQALGSFQTGSKGPRFKARKITLGRASLSSVPVVGGIVNRRLVSQFEVAPEWGALAEVWADVAAIDISEGVATFTIE